MPPNSENVCLLGGKPEVSGSIQNGAFDPKPKFAALCNVFFTNDDENL